MFRSFLVITGILLFSSFREYSLNHFNHFIEPSVLAEGDIYQLSVTHEGIFKLDYNFLKNELGVPNIDNRDPKNIQLYGLDGGMLDEVVPFGIKTGLEEVSVLIDGGQDGKFDTKDYILFYASGPDEKSWNQADHMLLVKKNHYSRTANFLLKWGNTAGKRIASKTDEPFGSANPISQYLEVQHYEDEKVNLLAGRTVTYGSGKQWYGDYFKTLRKKDYSSAFDFQNSLQGSTTLFKIGFAGRSDAYTDLIFQINNQKTKLTIQPTLTGDVEDDIARETHQVVTTEMYSPMSISIDYPNSVQPSEGWLNYITANFYHPLTWAGRPFRLFNPDATNKKNIYSIAQAIPTLSIWNIAVPLNPIQTGYNIVNGNAEFYHDASQSQGIFMIFDKSAAIESPTKGPKIKNQDLASISGVSSIILYYPDFEDAAKKLAAHRTQYSAINSEPISIDKVFIEYAAGRPDPTAIRNFARQCYLNDPDFKYLVLLGDGSYDYLGLNKDLKNENFIPVYETDESLSPIFAFPSDDYFGLLEEGEGGTDLLGDLDIAVGRIPVRSKDEANTIIDKIIHYDLLGSENDWKLRIAFSADDEDSNIHLEQSEEVSSGLEKAHPEFNVQKIYLDAFKQISGAGGEIIPGANESLSKNIFQGLLVFNYLGHGGPKGLSQEGLLRNSDVESWSNKDRLPVVITATCSFAPFDDPNVNSTGEALLRSTYGGAVALLTTVRNVYSSSNRILTLAVFDNLFLKDDDGRPLTLGTIMQKAKNTISSNGFDRTNARKFALIGDPTQRLSIPSNKVVTTHINSRAVVNGVRDTIKSLQLLTIKGMITSERQQLLEDFYGNVSVTLYDKKSVVKTLGQNDNSLPRPFQVQNSVLFKGNASVEKGRFEIQFVVPRDIDYSYGPGKISYFANSLDSVEATGSYSDLIIGGSQNQISDQSGPEIKLYINHYQFIDGEETHPNPLLLVNIYDENGINATGNSIGHDLIAVLDDNKQYVLNEFYIASQGDYKSGKVTFPFTGLAPGLHHLKVRAWDVANNSSEAVISFVVIDPNAPTHILSLTAYPNPFTDVINAQLVHNLSSVTTATVKISLLTSSGQILYSKEQFLSPAPVVDIRLQLNKNLPDGLYVLMTEILQGNKRIDTKGIKILRFP